jgi:hypothetical protein
MPFIKKKPLSPQTRCTHPEHDPPNMIVLEPGEYTWQCPACGKTVTFTVPLIILGKRVESVSGRADQATADYRICMKPKPDGRTEGSPSA